MEEANRKPWSQEEVALLNALRKKKKTYDQIAVILGRSKSSIHAYIKRHKITVHRVQKPWTLEDIIALQEDWKDTSLTLAGIAIKHRRTIMAIKGKARVLGLGPRPTIGEYFTEKELLSFLNISSYRLHKWVNDGLPTHKSKSNPRFSRVYDIEEVLYFLKNHPDLFKASMLNTSMLTSIPQWLREKYFNELDNKGNKDVKHFGYWSEEEELRLRQLKSRGMSVKDIAKELGRSVGAVRGKAYYLKYNPITKPYTIKEVEFLKNNSNKLSFRELKTYFPDRTEAALKCKLYRLRSSGELA